jgi:hypothetical protein
MTLAAGGVGSGQNRWLRVFAPLVLSTTAAHGFGLRAQIGQGFSLARNACEGAEEQSTDNQRAAQTRVHIDDDQNADDRGCQPIQEERPSKVVVGALSIFTCHRPISSSPSTQADD